MLTFDLENSLPTPVLTTGVVYYKRQLWTYNQGIHYCSTDKACMHMWDESTASRGSHELGSCVLDHIKEMETDATNLTFYSDACGGQNRNIYLVCLWLHIVASSDYLYTNIDHKFMISGHSYLHSSQWILATSSCLKKKTAHIVVPEDWEKVVTQARCKNPLHVTRMKREDFVSLKPLKATIVNRKKNTVHGKVEWLKMHWISVSKDKPLQFRHKYSINTQECWKTVNLQCKTKGRPPDMGRIVLCHLYDGPRPIKKEKVSGTS